MELLTRQFRHEVRACCSPPEPVVETAAAWSTPCRQWGMGGDFLEVLSVAEHQVSLVLADISGHGSGAANYAAVVQQALRRLLQANPSPARLLEALNADLLQQKLIGTFPEDAYACVIATCFDVRDGELRSAVAGMQAPLVLSGGAPARSIEAGGHPAGMFPATAYSETITRLYPGDLLVMATDGITEARSTGAFLDMAGWIGILETITPEIPLPTLVSHLFAEVVIFAGGRLCDDAALLVMKWNAAPGEPALATCIV